MPSSDTFEGLLEKGPDSSLLRYSLANAYVSESRLSDAIEQLNKALELDAQYSAAWKLLGRCYVDTGEYASAITSYEKGIVVAESKGDKQAAKEMKIFLKRAVKKSGDSTES